MVQKHYRHKWMKVVVSDYFCSRWLSLLLSLADIHAQLLLIIPCDYGEQGWCFPHKGMCLVPLPKMIQKNGHEHSVRDGPLIVTEEFRRNFLINVSTKFRKTTKDVVDFRASNTQPESCYYHEKPRKVKESTLGKNWTEVMVTQPKGKLTWQKHSYSALDLYQGCPTQPWPNPTRNKRARSPLDCALGGWLWTLSRVEKNKEAKGADSIIYNLVLCETWEVVGQFCRLHCSKKKCKETGFLLMEIIFCFPSFLTQPSY